MLFFVFDMVSFLGFVMIT